MQLLYDSEAFAVMRIDVPAATVPVGAGAPAAAAAGRGGYEIVDKFAQAGIWLDGALAERFRSGVEALAADHPSTDQIDAFIAGYTGLPHLPLTLH